MKKLKQIKIPWWVKKAPWIPIIILGGLIFTSIFAESLAPYSPTAISLHDRLLPPGTEGHILGTDTLGRDLLTRLFYGGRVSLVVAAVTVLVSGTIGLTVAIVAGYLGGIVDAILMRVVDIFLSFPDILIAILFAVVLGPGMQTIIIAISISYWARFARTLRADVLQIKEQEYVSLAKVAGCSPAYIMVKHILPNVLDTFLVVTSLQIGMVIRLESTLSFLGAGIAPPTPSWGQMVGDGRDYITTAWWICIMPGGALAAIVLSFNMLGDWIRDMLDPQIRAVIGVEAIRNRKRWPARLTSLFRRQISANYKNEGV